MMPQRFMLTPIIATTICLLSGSFSVLLGAEPVPSFGGNGHYINIGTPAALQIPSGAPFTIEGWMYLNALSSPDMLYSKNNARSGAPYDYMLGFVNGNITAYDGSNWRYPSPAGDPIITERWYHVAFSYDGSNMDYYLDGELVGTYTGWSFSNNPDNSIKMGGYTGSAGDINGMKSEVRVWNVARSAGQIQTNMNFRLKGAELGLVGHWPLNEGTGTKALDRTVNANTGTIVNAGWTVAEDLTLLIPDVEALPPGVGQADPFRLQDLETGSEGFTNSNEVDLAVFPIPEGYDVYQFTEDGALAAVDPDGWVATNTIPERILFTQPSGDTNVTLYAWFTNTTEAVMLNRAHGQITFTSEPPLPELRATHARERIPGEAVVVSPEEIDDGSSGGITGEYAIPLHILWLNLIDGPDTNTTPEKPYITVTELGEYTLSLTAINAAGNVATSTATCTLTVEEFGGQFVWTGGGDGSDWHDMFNWDPLGVPVDDVPVIIDSGASVLLSKSTAALSSLWLTNATLTMANWDTVLEADTVMIDAGGVITLPAAFSNTAMSNRIHIVCGEFALAANGTLNADGLGYGTDSGPGTTLSTHVAIRGSGGAGYGGIGGRAASVGGTVYGDPVFPTDPGSGSGNSHQGLGRSGGGAIYLDVAGQATINGLVSANGVEGGGGAANRYRGGGSGGSILLLCETVSGSGTLQAKGGNHFDDAVHPGGGGGGGRIAVHFVPSAQAALPRPGLILSAAAGTTGLPQFADNFWDQSDAGSLYLTAIDEIFALTSPIDGINGYLLEPGLAQRTFGDLTVLSGSALGFDANMSITVNGNLTVADGGAMIARHALALECHGNVDAQGRIFLRDENLLTIAGGVDVAGAGAEMALFPTHLEIGLDLDVRNAGILRFYGAPTNGLPDEVGGEVAVSGDFRIKTEGTVKLYSDPYNGGSVRIACRNLMVDAQSGIDADSKGFRADQGPGSTVSTGTSAGGSAGAGHGGKGGDSSGGRVGGSTYGSRLMPRDAGSAAGSTQQGRSDAGGSVIWFDVDNRIDLHGVLSARGGDGFSGGGARHRGGCAGGSILLFCRYIAGTGSLAAGGGNGYDDLTNASGGGGGGRIAVWYGLDRADRQPLLDNLSDPSVQRRLIETLVASQFEGEAIDVSGGAGYEDGGEDGTLALIKMLAPPGTLIMLR